MKVAVCIPARYHSTRFPGKPLATIAGETMIRRVYRGARSARRADFVAVLSDDNRIVDHIRAIGGDAYRVDGDFRSGTDRIAAFVKDKPFDLVVNVQGDEPLIDGGVVDELIDCIVRSNAPMATLARPCEPELKDDPDVVKLVVDREGYAIYFSRLPIPFNRNPFEDYLMHIGVYAYRKKTLIDLAGMPESVLEKAEGLEQLRALENGIKIKVCMCNKKLIGVDTPEDIQKVERHLKGNSHV